MAAAGNVLRVFNGCLRAIRAVTFRLASQLAIGSLILFSLKGTKSLEVKGTS